MTLLTAGIIATCMGAILHLYMRRKYQDRLPGRFGKCPIGFHLMFGLQYVVLIGGMSTVFTVLFN